MRSNLPLNQWRIYDHPIQLEPFYHQLNPKHVLSDHVQTEIICQIMIFIRIKLIYILRLLPDNDHQVKVIMM